MPPFDRFIASFLTATNENTAALVSAKVDFTLFKFDAPSEYSSVGSALSAVRRSDAESGPVHRTARRLAALFEHCVPNTPKLVAAYGKRVSSIITRSDVNPRGSTKDGPFQSFVGADGTAMWAAATSGAGAMGVYLLACFLSRLWDAKYAISIWVELIESRRAEIRTGFARGEKVSESALMSTLQEISRQDLAIWDASARAWLRTAEQVKHVEWQLTQLHLVTKDLVLPFASGPTMYARVISSWTQAMQGLEDLLNGIPQQISDAAILTAFASWHLFPDVIVLGKSPIKVSLRDELFPKSAISTIGLRARRPEKDVGMRWSLVLSHLQYYGPPVEVTTYASPPRITFFKLRLAALGSLFARWHLNHRHYLEAAKFLSTLWEIILEASRSSNHRPPTEQFEWLDVFVQAANDLLLAHSNAESTFNDYLRLVKFGARRGARFLGPPEADIKPFFGLLNRAVLMALAAPGEADAAISYLRCIAEDSGCEPQNGVVVCGHWGAGANAFSNPDFYEHASIFPRSLKSKKRKADSGKYVDRTAVGHWFFTGKAEMASSAVNDRLATRIAGLQALGVWCEDMPEDDWTALNRQKFTWSRAPQLFSESPPLKPSQTEPDGRSDDRKRIPQWMSSGADASFIIVEGSHACGLALTGDKNLKMDTQYGIQAAITYIKESANHEMLLRYLCCVVRESWTFCTDGSAWAAPPPRDDVGIGFVAKRFAIPGDICVALHSLALANLVFASVDVPTISLECLDFSLHEARWLSGLRPRSTTSSLQAPIPKQPTREEAFACICFFDSGSIDIPPEKLNGVFAMCCNNSIYVAAIALSDPAEQVPSYEIRHIMGNIGRGGISMLVSPKTPQIRPISHDYRVVGHQDYDFKRENNFRDTTLHLSFTEWTIPIIDTDLSRIIDHEVNFVETVTSVYERGCWVADLDILSIDFANLNIANNQKKQKPCECEPSANQKLILDYDIKTVDSWEELLDEPKTMCIVRAHGNWAARLAATSILYQQEQGHATCLFHQSDICIGCLVRERDDIGRVGLDQYEANLPHFCID